jgi:phosphomannomutase
VSDLLDRARAWLAEDPDPTTRAELADLVAQAGAETWADSTSSSGAAAELADRFDGRLEFGTAGLRGALGAGPNRMNRVVVVRAAAGLASYLLEREAPGGTVVIGYDARHRSEDFARDTAAVMAGAGLHAVLLPRALPTPLLAHAVLRLGAVAGVMVTASHNPPRDNGYKVYLGDGCQIVPPADADISAHIDAVGALADVPRSADWRPADEEVVDGYVRAVADLVTAGPRDLTWVYTPMHGVGGQVVAAVVERAGFPAAHVVAAQEEPDPDFPTVAFPNPEEPGAMDLALDLAAEVGADLVVANDPDADRCAVAVPDGAGRGTDGWRVLRGDELGALLGDALLRRGVEGVYARSIVSSSLLGALAASYDQPSQETLTGFKWIARVDGLAFGFEEALGYCVAPGLVRDKDGVSALVLVLELAAALRAEGRTLVDRLDEIAREHDLHATDQLSVRVSDLALIGRAMQRLRDEPPTSLGGLDVEQAEDLSLGVDGLPPTDGLRYRLAERGRVVVRPSGTEPKIKCYLEVVEPVSGDEPVAAARARAATRLAAIRDDVAAAAGL